VTDPPRTEHRTLRWAGGRPTTWPQPPWALAAHGTLASGERPVNTDALIRLAPGGPIWRVAEASHTVLRGGPITLTLHLVEPETTLP
jgi:hypothetical protein